MIFRPFIAGMLAVLLVAPPAFAWGVEGHEIVAAVAADRLTPRAKAAIGRLLGGDAAALMIHQASWADEIRDQRPDTSRRHFVNIPLDGGSYDPRRDCPGGECVVAEIARDETILRDPHRSMSEKREALLFLIHFIGDVHQPLHAADNGDRGGNDVRVYVDGQRTSLHHLWDMQLVEAQGFDSSQVARGILAATPPSRQRQWQAGAPADWANESFRQARDDIYAFSRGRRTLHIGHGYIRHEMPVVETQLAKAGIRLAWVLNTIFAR